MSEDILDLIDNALDAYDVSGDAMRWTPEAPEQSDGLPEISFGFHCGGVIHSGAYYVVDETHCWQDITEHVRNLPANITRVWMPASTSVTFTLDNRDTTFRRTYLDDEVPSGLSRESNPVSAERPTDG